MPLPKKSLPSIDNLLTEEKSPPVQDVASEAFEDSFEDINDDLVDIEDVFNDSPREMPSIPDDPYAADKMEEFSGDFEEDFDDEIIDLTDEDLTYAHANIDIQKPEPREIPDIDNEIENYLSEEDEKLKKKKAPREKIDIAKYKKPLMIAGGAVVLIIVLLILSSIIFGGEDTSEPSSSTATEQPTEEVSDARINFRDSYVENGEYFVVIKTNDIVNARYIESVVLADNGIFRCFTPEITLEKGESTVKLEDCETDMSTINIKETMNYVDVLGSSN